MEWGISRVSCKTTKCTSRCCRGTGRPYRAQDRQLRDRVSLFVMGNQCSGPSKAYLRHLVFPAHISLAALNRPVWLPLWRPLSLPYPRYTPTPSYTCWAKCIAISSSVLWTPPKYDPGREEKDFFLLFGGLSLVKPKMPQDKVKLLLGRGHDQ